MLINELFEARNWDREDDPADRWLAKYTYENLDKWPSAEIVKTLLARYGNPEPQVLYRGINFRTKEQWDKFIQEFGGQQEADIRTGGISSWTTREGEAQQFAIVQPTYYPDEETFRQEKEARKNAEILRGHRGVILRTEIAAGQGIDVNRSGKGHESETILPPGTHRITIVKEIKPFAQHLQDGDHTVDDAILGMTRHDLTGSGDDKFRNGLFNHVLALHADKLSEEARRHLFKLVYPKRQGIFDVDVTPNRRHDWSTPDIAADWCQEVVSVFYSRWFFELTERGLFVPEDQGKAKRIAAQLARWFIKLVDQHPNAYFRCKGIASIFRLAGMDTQLTRLRKKLVGARYHELNSLEAVRGVNDRIAAAKPERIPSWGSHSEITKHMKSVEAVMQQMGELR
jgi:hypothetical protein